MFDDNSVIYGICFIEEKNFDNFLMNFFDDNGLCLIKGVSISKEEAEEKIKESKLKNEKIRAKELKMLINASVNAASKMGLSKEEADEMLRKKLNSSEDELYKYCMFDSLLIPIKIDVLQIGNDQIKEFICNGSIETNDEIIGKRIYLDDRIYGLNGALKKLPDDSFIIPNEKKEEMLKEDSEKRESIIEGILNYKKKFENISDGTFENESTPSQLSGGRHI